MPSLLGVDVGGTFTDFLLAQDGRVHVYKRPSTPGDPARAVLDGLAEMQAEPDHVAHGSTVATNAIIERRGARTALITTNGFRDVLLIGRQARPQLYDLSPHRPPPLVPDDLRLEADERLDHRGETLRPLDPAEVERLLDDLQAQGVESLAVCFLFSFLDPSHERIVAGAARKRGIPVSPSHEVLPEHREYERTATTVANAYVAPVVSRYLSRLESELGKRGVSALRVMGSSGGGMSPRAAGRLAVRTALSGPAGGVTGAFQVASAAGFDRVITLDMGGTSTDVSTCPGRVGERDEAHVGGLPLRGPSVDVLSVGAGGGSIARIDAGGALRVGPESAGADPGPAFYGRGHEPTVTDAHVVLGRITPESFLGGRMDVYPERSRQAIETIAGPYGGDATAAAAAVLRVANANMERALRVVSVERGHDPRLFTLVAFGGAGPLHACDLAAALRMPRVLVPLHAGVLSALGIAAAPVTKDLSASVMLTLPADGAGWEDARRTLAERAEDLERQGLAELRDEGLERDGATASRFLEMRYAGQSYELSVLSDALAPGGFLAGFHALHHERYSHSDPSRPVEIVSVRVRLTLPAAADPLALSATGEEEAGPKLRDESRSTTSRAGGRAAPPTASLPGGAGPKLRDSSRSPTSRAGGRAEPRAGNRSGSAAIVDRRTVWFESDLPLPGRERAGLRVDTPVYDRSRLSPGDAIAGPAIVVQMDATTAVPPAWSGAVDRVGNLLLERADA